MRKQALPLIKSIFQEARAKVRTEVEAGLPGLAAARALSALQDAMIQVIYDFATKHFYYAQNPTSAERLAVVATGGYGRGELAPGSDIDLLFVRPFKQTAWGESVIEFILYMLWDLGLKVGHATRSPGGMRAPGQAGHHHPHRAAGSALSVGRPASSIDELRKKFWSEVATGNGRDFVEAKLAERDERHARQGESRYLVEPNIKEGKGGLRDLQTLYWIGKYLYHVEDAADLVEHNVFTRDEYKTFQKAEAFLWNVRVHLHYLLGRAEERLSFDVQPALAAALGYRRCRKAAPRGGSLHARLLPGRQGCRRPHPHLLRRAGGAEPQAAPVAAPHAAGLPASRAASDDDFYVENGRLNADPAHLPPRSGQSPAHLPYRRREERRHPSRCAAHRSPARSISSPTRCGTIRRPTACSWRC